MSKQSKLKQAAERAAQQAKQQATPVAKTVAKQAGKAGAQVISAEVRKKADALKKELLARRGNKLVDNDSLDQCCLGFILGPLKRGGAAVIDTVADVVTEEIPNVVENVLDSFFGEDVEEAKKS